MPAAHKKIINRIIEKVIPYWISKGFNWEHRLVNIRLSQEDINEIIFRMKEIKKSAKPKPRPAS